MSPATTPNTQTLGGHRQKYKIQTRKSPIEYNSTRLPTNREKTHGKRNEFEYEEEGENEEAKTMREVHKIEAVALFDATQYLRM